MPGLVPGIHVFGSSGKKDVDGRAMTKKRFSRYGARFMRMTIICWAVESRLFQVQ
jgi:hypothetical protein